MQVRCVCVSWVLVVVLCLTLEENAFVYRILCISS